MKTLSLRIVALLLLVSVAVVAVVNAQECFDAGDCLDTEDADALTLEQLENLSSVDTTNHNNNSSDLIPDILILICTQSFTGEELVEDVLLDALLDNDNNWKVDVQLVDEAGLDWTEETLQQETQSNLQLSHHARMVLIVASTYGDGDPPNHALQFANWLQTSPFAWERLPV